MAGEAWAPSDGIDGLPRYPSSKGQCHTIYVKFQPYPVLKMNENY